MQNGEIRICRINKNEPTDLSDYLLLPMHDNSNGKISKILLSHDETMLLTCGWDGNLFSYRINENLFVKKNGEQPTASKKLVRLICKYNLLFKKKFESNHYLTD